jgi:hypothetical protein
MVRLCSAPRQVHVDRNAGVLRGVPEVAHSSSKSGLPRPTVLLTIAPL